MCDVFDQRSQWFASTFAASGTRQRRAQSRTIYFLRAADQRFVKRFHFSVCMRLEYSSRSSILEDVSRTASRSDAAIRFAK
jgi:hypothetical protein